ncbi:hypothetical protein HQ560_12075 [bacterium]|nr:hypothetical protein [bacterium]
MSFLRKNFVWILLAAILVGEGVFAYMLLGKQGEAKKASDDVEAKKAILGTLRSKTANYDARLKALKARRHAIEDERGECVLFFWERDQLVNGLFDSPELAKFKATPWTKYPPDRLGLFRLAYQKAYDAAVAGLAETLVKMRSDRARAGFIPLNEFTKPEVTLGDIYREQKDFWVRKAVVEAAAQAGVNRLEQVMIELPSRRRANIGHAAAKTAVTSDANILVHVQCSYRAWTAFLEAMGKSPLGFRVRKVDSAHRLRFGGEAAKSKAVAAVRSAASAVDPSAIQGVEGKVVFTLPLSNVAIDTITFPASTFKAGKPDVQKWLTKRIALLQRNLKNVPGLVKSSWRDEERKKLPAAAKDGKTKTEAVVIHDELMGGGRDYKFRDSKDAARWINEREAFETRRIEGRLALWRRVQVLLEDDTRVVSKGGIVVDVRPVDQLDKAPDKRYPFVIDRTSKVSLAFGLLTFVPELSDTVSRTE